MALWINYDAIDTDWPMAGKGRGNGVGMDWSKNETITLSSALTKHSHAHVSSYDKQVVEILASLPQTR